MKTITFKYVELHYVLDSLPRITLIIENKKLFCSFMQYCNLGFLGNEDYIKVFEEPELLSNDKNICYIANIFDLNLNTKKNVNALYKILKHKYYEELKDKIHSLKENISSIVTSISMDFDIELSLSGDIQEDDLFKMMNLQFLDKDLSLMEKLIKYIFVINELQKSSVFIINHLYDYFDKSEIETIYHELEYRGITLINVENRENNVKIENEIKIIIDNDMFAIE